MRRGRRDLTGKGGAAFVAALALSGGARARADGSPNVAPGAPPPFETVVTAPQPAAPAPREDRAASASVVLPGDSPRAHDDVGTLMTEVPGVTTTRTGALGSFTTLSLRGSNPDQVRFVIDGVPIAIAEGGAVDVSTLPLGDVERVEVYRGQAPLAFGESALGGIVSITTHTPGTPSLGARAGMGSFGATFGDVHAGDRVGRLRLYMGLHGLLSTGDFPYVNDNGTPLNPADDQSTPRRNNDVRQADGTVRAAMDLPGRRTLNLGVITFARDQGLAGPHLAQTRFVRFQTGRGIGYLRYESRDDLGEGGRLTAQLYASYERDHYSDPGELSAGVWQTHDTTESAGATLGAARPMASWLRLATLAEARAETFQPVNDGDEVMPVGTPARRLVGVAGAEATLRWARAELEAIPTARVEVMQDIVTGRDPLLQTQRPAAPPIDRALPVLRLALVRPLGEHTILKANVGRYARAPSFLELYAGTGRLLGNPDLRPERGTNADVAVVVEAGTRVRVSSRAAVFGAEVSSLIEWQHDSYGHARPSNVGAARILGAEEELRLAAGRWARFVGQATFLDARDTSDDEAHHGRQLPLRPRWQAYARPEVVHVPLGRGGEPGRGLEVGAFVDGAFVAGSFDDPANLFELPPRLLVGAGVSVEAPRWGARATCSAQNLTDTPVWDMAYWPLPGRTIFLALAWQGALGNAATNQGTKQNRSE
ncbi:MAG TPA: TonB-dependent receptor [Polyangia bacterium]|nr:TonB-dependent receptor [Polyangia bacterium]